MPCHICESATRDEATCSRCASQIHPLFSLGALVATPGALEVMTRLDVNGAGLLARHVRGD